MKNIYYTADVVHDNDIPDDTCSLKLLHDSSGFKVVVVSSCNKKLINHIIGVLTCETDISEYEIDKKVSDCIERFGDGREFTIILISKNIFHCYASSRENILIFKKKNIFGLGYNICDLSRTLDNCSDGFAVYTCSGHVREGYYFLINNMYRYDIHMKKYMCRLFYTNNIFRRKKLGYKSNRELIAIIKSICTGTKKYDAGSVALVACNGRL